MKWVLLEIKNGRTFLSPPPPPPPLSLSSSHFDLNNKVSPSMLLIIIILAIIFFISGLLHLLIRFLLRPQNRGGATDGTENDVTALQGQLQQLFHLHDSGVDQSFIDTLPIFNYKAIIGVKDPFDCAVCLCEFEAEDNLRLLPKCSHAFHVDCIDTWLLSHSTCPLCRASLLCPDFPLCSPMVLVLESGSENGSREIVFPVERVNSHLSITNGEIEEEEETGENRGKQGKTGEKTGEKVVSVKLGKIRSVDNGGEEGSNSGANADARRCFSMGSFAYVMDENSSLRVPIMTPMKNNQSGKRKPCLPPLTPGHRLAMSECGCDSTREFNGFDSFKVLDIPKNDDDDDDGKSIGKTKESFSVSKIWLRGKKDKGSAAWMESSRRAFSSRFAVHRNTVGVDEAKGKNGEEDQMERCDSLDSLGNQPSFGRGTLFWLMGRQNKVVHSSFSTNV